MTYLRDGGIVDVLWKLWTLIDVIVIDKFPLKKKQKNKKHFLQGLTLNPRNCHFYLLSVKYHTSFLTFYPPLSCHTYSGNTIFRYSERHTHMTQLASISHFIPIFFFL